MSVLIWAILGYVAGSIPSAYLASVVWGRRAVLDHAKRGSGGADAHVLLREAGAGRAATAAATLDVLKALVPTLIAARVAGPYPAAACAVGAVCGHCWPPFLRIFAGRGLAASAGSFLALLPFEMVVAGVVTAVGSLSKAGGVSSMVGFASIPVVAHLRGQPAPYRLMAWVILAMILARRLEGMGEDLSQGASPVRSVASRVLFDAPPAER